MIREMIRDMNKNQGRCDQRERETDLFNREREREFK